MPIRAKWIIGCLTITIIVLAFLLYRSHKRLNDYVEHVQASSDLLSVGSLELQQQIDDLQVLKADTTPEEHAVFIYSDLKNSGIISNAGNKLFYLVVALHENKSNQSDLNKLLQSYSIVKHNINVFLITHRTLSEVKAGEIDTLIGYYQELKNLTETVENIKIDP